MRSVPLRLFLLICVAAMLRPDVCQAQGQQYLTPTEFAAALLIHFGSPDDAQADSAATHEITSRQPVRSANASWPRPAAFASAAMPVAPVTIRPASHTRFKARSSLPADPDAALARS